MKAELEKIGREILPSSARRWLRAWIGNGAPPPGKVRFGDLRRRTPISRTFGFDRGRPVDRYYIENFLRLHSRDIQGRVLEIADDTYTRQFGGQRVTASEVLHARVGNPAATIVADLSAGDNLASDQFDCVILTQTLPCIYDVQSAVRTVHRILKSGGVVLATAPGISQIAQPDMQIWGDYWRFTTLSLRRLFEEFFSPPKVEVKSYGNVLVATAFLQGLAGHELCQEELDFRDPDYQVTISVRAVKDG